MVSYNVLKNVFKFEKYNHERYVDEPFKSIPVSKFIREIFRYELCATCSAFDQNLGCTAGLYDFEDRPPLLRRRLGDVSCSGLITWQYNDYYADEERLPCYGKYQCSNEGLQITSSNWHGKRARFTIDGGCYSGYVVHDFKDDSAHKVGTVAAAKSFCEEKLGKERAEGKSEHTGSYIF
jgi:hypothetical protein